MRVPSYKGGGGDGERTFLSSCPWRSTRTAPERCKSWWRRRARRSRSRAGNSALKPGVVTLIKDLNGNHVIQRCLQRLGADDNQFVYDAARVHSVEIATHRHGCCVLQRCIDHAAESQRRALVQEIASQALVLSQDPFGNYVVQYILDLGLPWCNAEVMMRLAGNYAELSMQKFSSNVVEKCLKLADASLEEHRNVVVREIMTSPLLDRLLMDPYGNYVVQSTLSVTKGTLHSELVERIDRTCHSSRTAPSASASSVCSSRTRSEYRRRRIGRDERHQRHWGDYRPRRSDVARLLSCSLARVQLILSASATGFASNVRASRRRCTTTQLLQPKCMNVWFDCTISHITRVPHRDAVLVITKTPTSTRLAPSPRRRAPRFSPEDKIFSERG